MLSIAGQPMVVLAARRAANEGAAVVIATSEQAEDDVIASAAHRAGIDVVRGPLDDPLARFAIACRDLDDGDVVVRLTADNVLPDGNLVSALIGAVGSGPHRYVRVGGDDLSVPYGIAGEAFTAGALREADNAPDADREHVTPWIRERHGDAVLDLSDVSSQWRGLRCTVDTFDDYVRLARLFSTASDPLTATWRDLCDALLKQEGPAATPWPATSENALGQSPVVLGTVQLGLSYGVANRQGIPSPEDAQEILRAAARSGITHVDSARAYGLSEERIGQALSRGLSESVGVVTKVLPLDDLPADADPAWCRSAVQASVATSLQKLGTDRVDALLMHRAGDWAKGSGAVRQTLVGLREAGVCRVVGVSVSSAAELRDVLADPECGYVQLPFNLLDWRWTGGEVEDALARRPDVVVTCRSVYLQGLLLGDKNLPWPANSGVDPSDVRTLLRSLVDELGRTSTADLCLAYVLGHPWVSSVVLGAESAEQVTESVAVARRPPLDSDEIKHVQSRLPRVAEELLDPSRWTW